MRFNIAARRALEPDNWKKAVGAWLVFCVLAVALGGAAGTKVLKEADTSAGGITPRAVEKHVTSIFTKLGLPAAAEDHRRVLAVLQFLGS